MSAASVAEVNRISPFINRLETLIGSRMRKK
jgi:hypothetical protein